jgi:hypothetical protein
MILRMERIIDGTCPHGAGSNREVGCKQEDQHSSKIIENRR